MSDLRARLLLWHKLINQITGSMSLLYSRKGLSRSEAISWADRLQSVSEDIRAVMDGKEFILDNKGQRVVKLPTVEDVETDDEISGKEAGHGNRPGKARPSRL